MTIFLISFHLIPVGLLALTAAMKAVILSASCAGVKLTLPMRAWILPVLSSLNSNLHFLISAIVDGRSVVTVPDLGFGMIPLGQRIFATFARSFIRSGVVTRISNSMSPFSIFWMRSVNPAISAPADFAAATLSSVVKTATLTVLPLP